MKKRILPALLALCMVMSLLPVVFAEDEPATPTKKDPTVVEKTEYVSCAAVAAYAKTDEGKADNNIGTDPHGEDITCAASGCQCGLKVTTTTTTYDDNGVAQEPTVKVTYKYATALCEACSKNATCNPCTESNDGTCKAATHKGDCDMKCYYCSNTKGSTQVKVTVDGKEKTVSICDTCAKDGTKNPCGAGADKDGKGGCTLYKGHTEKHNSANCTSDDKCNASLHNENCKMACGVCGKANGASDGDDVKCTRTKNHKGAHNNSTCIADDNCGAATHFAGTAMPEKPENGEKDENKDGWVDGKEPCPVLTKSNQCGYGGCTLAKGHVGDHNNDKCLGYNDDGHCGVEGTAHIIGCSEYRCECWTWDGSAKTWTAKAGHEKCTYSAGCPVCNANEDCDCPVCRANPAMGAVTDAEGNEVDPADPTETPTKAEGFTDMEDWMAADVQVALDKGWMQGIGDGKFDGRAATTGTMVAAVLARMDGEEITGTDWDKDALAWAEGKDVFEGVELTGESMARKDLVLVIWRMADKPDSDFELTFTDVDGLEGDHLTAMKWAAENGIVKGNGDDTVTPDGSVTRAALCAMLARYDGLEK